MKNKLTVLALGALLSAGQVHGMGDAAFRAQLGAQAGHAFGAMPFGAKLITLAGIASIPVWYYGVPFKAGYRAWFMAKSYETVVSESVDCLKKTNERYIDAFALASESDDTTKLKKTKAFAASFQAKYRRTDATQFEKFHSQVTAVYNKLEEFPITFAATTAEYDLSWIKLYLERVQNGDLYNQLSKTSEQLQTFIDYIRTSELYLQEQLVIKQESNRWAYNYPQMIGKPLRVMASTLAATICTAIAVRILGYL